MRLYLKVDTVVTVIKSLQSIIDEIVFLAV